MPKMVVVESKAGHVIEMAKLSFDRIWGPKGRKGGFTLATPNDEGEFELTPHALGAEPDEKAEEALKRIRGEQGALSGGGEVDGEAAAVVDSTADAGLSSSAAGVAQAGTADAPVPATAARNQQRNAGVTATGDSSQTSS